MEPGRMDMNTWGQAANLSASLKAKVLRVLEDESIHSEYQPIIDVETESLIGYEALARFDLDGEDVAPNLVFNSLHQDHTLLFWLESKLKKLQLEHRPRKGRLFVNLDPHVCVEPYQVQHWTELFQGAKDIVVELIENTSSTNLQAVQGFLRSMNKIGVPCALDDIGGPRNLFCFDFLDDCRFIKLDRRWFWRIEHETAYQDLARGLVDFARAKGIGCVIEGVESRRHLNLARQLGVQLVQGFLFRDLVQHSDRPAPPVPAPRRAPASRRPSSRALAPTPVRIQAVLNPTFPT